MDTTEQEARDRYIKKQAERAFVSGLGVPMDDPRFESRMFAAEILWRIDERQAEQALDGEQ